MIFFECKVKYDRTLDNGALKSVTESYAVDAMTFTEAEARITEEMRPYVNGEFAVKSIKIANYREYEARDGDRYFLVKFNLITVDDMGREKKAPLFVLFRSSDLDTAKEAAHAYMKGSLIDYEISYIKETSLLDVFVHGD